MRPGESICLDGETRRRRSHKIVLAIRGTPLSPLPPPLQRHRLCRWALLLKRASDLGADVWRSTRIINYTTSPDGRAVLAARRNDSRRLHCGGSPSSQARFSLRASFHTARVDHRRRLRRHACSGFEDFARRAAERRAHRRPHRRAPLDGGGLEQRRHRAAEFSPGHSHGASRSTIVLAALGAAAYACSTCWCRSGRPCGAPAGSCRWRWPAAPRIHSRCVVVQRAELSRSARRSAVNRAPTLPGSPPAPCVSPCRV